MTSKPRAKKTTVADKVATTPSLPTPENAWGAATIWLRDDDRTVLLWHDEPKVPEPAMRSLDLTVRAMSRKHKIPYNTNELLRFVVHTLIDATLAYENDRLSNDLKLEISHWLSIISALTQARYWMVDHSAKLNQTNFNRIGAGSSKEALAIVQQNIETAKAKAASGSVPEANPAQSPPRIVH